MSRKLTTSSSSSTHMTSSRFSLRYGKTLSPTSRTAVPSAMVLAEGIFTAWPASRAAVSEGAPAGSTPITRIFGLYSFAKVATPQARPPPPTGTRMVSTSGSSWTISMPMVP